MTKKIARQPPRYSECGGLFFLTFCTYPRTPILHDKGIPELLIRSLEFYGNRLKELIAYTIMPDHIHLLVEVDTIEQVSSFLRDFKKYTSKEIKRTKSFSEQHIWQRGTMDHCIRFSWENKDLEHHVGYLFYNSWKHLHIRPKDFPYHNFDSMVKRGWLDEDFCDFPESQFHFEIYE